jgi:pimeloyl-ACP methyl ester carboxylesterase/predicted glycosyltransferase
MRAREPDRAGYVVRDGVRVYYEVFGAGTPTVLLMPTWPILHSRFWKLQVPYLAQHYRVLTFDPRGNGRSDRPPDAKAYADWQYAEDALAVLDETGTDRAIVAGLCPGVNWSIHFVTTHPERTLGLIAIAPGLAYLTPPHAHRAGLSFEEVRETYEGWAKFNRHHMREDYRDYVEWHSAEMFPEPHSTKPYDDGVEWGLGTDARTLTLTVEAPGFPNNREEAEELARRVRCPVLIIHGDQDRCQPLSRAHRLAEITGGKLVILEGAGHLSHVRNPVVVNMLMKDFVDTVAGGQPRHIIWERAMQRPRRALFISSSIGLGHIHRDLAVARELRALLPDLEITWWAQHPASVVLEAAGERLHPKNHLQALESAHWEEESSQHDLHAFYAFRRMDEIFLANFMLFHDITRETPYDIWIGDESWEVDYYLHENPELKSAPYVFMTDVIGFLPVDAANDPREAELTADYNGEMIEQRARFPYLRDLSLYVGEDYEELPDAPFGPGLPNIRAWAREWFEPVGYIVPFDPASYRDTETLRLRLGYGREYPLVMAAVGGTAVGRHLLRRIAEAVPLLREEVPDARVVMITGPRIDPRELPDVEGLEKRPYVHNLFEHLACADAAIVQGGLSTTMELVAAGRPFAYVPLRRHWEQQHYVSYRLSHYGVRTRLDFDQATPDRVAATLKGLLTQRPVYREIKPGGARRAAERIAALLQRSNGQPSDRSTGGTP